MRDATQTTLLPLVLSLAGCGLGVGLEEGSFGQDAPPPSFCQDGFRDADGHVIADMGVYGALASMSPPEREAWLAAPPAQRPPMPVASVAIGSDGQARRTWLNTYADLLLQAQQCVVEDTLAGGPAPGPLFTPTGTALEDGHPVGYTIEVGSADLDGCFDDSGRIDDFTLADDSNFQQVRDAIEASVGWLRDLHIAMLGSRTWLFDRIRLCHQENRDYSFWRSAELSLDQQVLVLRVPVNNYSSFVWQDASRSLIGQAWATGQHLPQTGNETYDEYLHLLWQLANPSGVPRNLLRRAMLDLGAQLGAEGGTIAELGRRWPRARDGNALPVQQVCGADVANRDPALCGLADDVAINLLGDEQGAAGSTRLQQALATLASRPALAERFTAAWRGFLADPDHIEGISEATLLGNFERVGVNSPLVIYQKCAINIANRHYIDVGLFFPRGRMYLDDIKTVDRAITVVQQPPENNTGVHATLTGYLRAGLPALARAFGYVSADLDSLCTATFDDVDVKTLTVLPAPTMARAALSSALETVLSETP